MAKLTNADVEVIRERVAKGEKQTELAAEYGVHNSNISRAVSKEQWRMV